MLRPYCDDDHDAVIEIANQAWAPIHEAYKRAYGKELFNLLFPTPATRVGENVSKCLAERPHEFLVVEDGGQVVAFISYWIEEDHSLGVIGYNGVRRDHQGQGIGQRMYAEVFDIFRKKGVRYAKVETGLDEGHAAARRAYKRAGFDIHHENVTYFMKL